ncbi:hypothetical protein MRX96_014291 [Rhipicephalus microplus]
MLSDPILPVRRPWQRQVGVSTMSRLSSCAPRSMATWRKHHDVHSAAARQSSATEASEVKKKKKARSDALPTFVMRLSVCAKSVPSGIPWDCVDSLEP